MIKQFKLGKAYGRTYTHIAQESLRDAHTIAIERKEALLPEHILISIITKQPDNWKHLQELVGESLRIELLDIEQWVQEYLSTSTDKDVQQRIGLFHEMASRAVTPSRQQFSIHTGHLIIGLLRLQNGFLTNLLTNMKIDVESVIAEFESHMESEDLNEPVDDSLLAFLETQKIDIILKESSQGDEVHLTIPAISLFQQLVNAFAYSQAGLSTYLDRPALTDTRNNGESISIHISPESDTNTP